MRIVLRIKEPATGWVTIDPKGKLALTNDKEKATVYDNEKEAFQDRFKAIKTVGPNTIIIFEFLPEEKAWAPNYQI
jgi:hypothetical protein